jgi:hypothetical protein
VRETRSHGSVRGVRSNPYPYRDTPTPDAEGSEELPTPKTPSRNTRTSPLNGAETATLTGLKKSDGIGITNDG